MIVEFESSTTNEFIGQLQEVLDFLDPFECCEYPTMRKIRNNIEKIIEKLKQAGG